MFSASFTRKVTCSGSDQSLDLEVMRDSFGFIADGDCFVAFDEPVTASHRFLIKANTEYFFHDAQARVIHYLADSSTPALYVTAFKIKK